VVTFSSIFNQITHFQIDFDTNATEMYVCLLQ
jgi:hypothetical protein